MKPRYKTLLLLCFSIGCSHAPTDPTPPATKANFGRAIETIAGSNDWNAVNDSAAVLYNGGLPAIDVLRLHLSDDREIPTNYSTRSVAGTLTIGDFAFWAIQDMVETGLPKMYGDTYSVLNRDNVDQWLDRRDGMSILELQVEAARLSCERAGDDGAQSAVDIYRERLRELADTT